MEQLLQGATADNLYTEEQRQYVAGVKDEDLRNHLLHQVRLRDNMEQDRNNFEKMLQKAQLKDKIIIDLEDMRNDQSGGSYFYAWQANIAMAFKDEWEKWSKEKVGRNATYDHRHEIANNAAKNFLNLLIK